MFITLEGGEGTGKTTVAKLLQEWVIQRGHLCLLTREPGGTALAEQIRGLFNSTRSEKVFPLTESLLVYAARSQHVEHVIKPALENKQWVICDRYIDSSWVYQGFLGNVSSDFLSQLDQMVCGLTFPDLTFILDIDVETALKRLNNRPEQKTRFDQKELNFHVGVREGYLARAKAYPQRIKLISTENKLPKEILSEIVSYIEEKRNL